jgi:hypothetical protein
VHGSADLLELAAKKQAREERRALVLAIALTVPMTVLFLQSVLV